MCVPNVKTFDQTEGYLSSLDRKTGPTDRQTDRPTKPFLGRPPGSGKKKRVIPGGFLLACGVSLALLTLAPIVLPSTDLLDFVVAISKSNPNEIVVIFLIYAATIFTNK